MAELYCFQMRGPILTTYVRPGMILQGSGPHQHSTDKETIKQLERYIPIGSIYGIFTPHLVDFYGKCR